jgi:hypothetical protein
MRFPRYDKEKESHMKKLSKIASLAVAFGLALAGAASAAVTDQPYDINVYGASAQYNFWSAEAANWLTSSTGANCTGTTTAVTYAAPGTAWLGTKYFIVQGTGCPNGQNTTVRVTAFDSYDGINAANGEPITISSVELVPGASACTGGQRMMLDSPTGGGATTNIACHPVTLGASDVTPDFLTQAVTGAPIDGPLGGSDITVNLKSAPLSTSSLAQYQPVVVPFGFYVNKDVSVTTCQGGNNPGALCNTANATAQCGSGITCGPSPSTCLGGTTPGKTCSVNSDCGNGSCMAGAINLSLDMASQVFSGAVSNWNQLGAAYPSQPLAICLRVPGSGTLAAFDYTILHRNNTTLLTNPQSSPTVYFNFTTGDELNCVNTVAGAIGFADADANLTNSCPGSTACTGLYGPIAYNGYGPSRQAIRNGLYDFWALENLWETQTSQNNTTTHNLVVNFTNYANLPANISAARPYYASSAEMLVLRNGTAYPVQAGGAGFLCTGGTNPGTICGFVGDTTCTGTGAACVQQNCSTTNPGICP